PISQADIAHANTIVRALDSGITRGCSQRGAFSEFAAGEIGHGFVLFLLYTAKQPFRMERSNHSRYIVKSLVHASHVLSAFRAEGEVLRLRDVVARTGFNKVMCFRLLYTLHSCGFLEKVGENQYRTVSDLRPNRKFRIGYASQGQDSSFPREVGASLVQAAEAAHVE